MDDQINVSAPSEPTPATSAVVLPGVMELIRRAWEFYKIHFKTLLGFLIAPAVLIALYSFFATDQSLWFFGVIALILAMLCGVGVFLVMLNLLATGQTGYSGMMNAYRAGASLFFSWILVAILQALATAGGLVLLVIPGVMLQILLAFSIYAFFLEGLRGRMALAKSWYYVKGNWWSVFGRFIAFSFIIAAISIIFSFVLGLIGIGGVIIASGVMYLVLVPLSAAYMFYMYAALKSTKPEPTMEVLAKNRKRITIFTIIGLIAPVILAFAFGAIMSFIFGRSPIIRDQLPQDFQQQYENLTPEAQQQFDQLYNEQHDEWLQQQ